MLPTSDDEARARSFDATFTEWDSSLFGIDVHVRTVVTKDHLYTEYRAGTMHDGSEGELYDLARRSHCSGSTASTTPRSRVSARRSPSGWRATSIVPANARRPVVLMAPV